MADFTWARRGVSILLLFWIFIFPTALLQPPLSLTLPVHMSVTPSPWQFLPLSQVELDPLFSNSSPFSFSQSLFMLPPHGQAPRPGLQASFGPYSVTQLISDPVLPPSPLMSASLLSEHVERERDGRGQVRFMVRTLFHNRGDTSTQGTCITLHAFKETEEHKASCMTQPPVGLCLVTLTLPSHWFKDQLTNQSHQDLWQRSTQPHHHTEKQKWQRRRHLHSNLANHTISPSMRYYSGAGGNRPQGPRYQRNPMRNQIQIYYSYSTVTDFEMRPQGCVAPSERQLIHIKALTMKEEVKDREGSRTKAEETCLNGQEGEELSLDHHVVIRYHRGLVLIGQPIMVSVNLRANFSAEFIVIRMKVKRGLVSLVAQRTLTSDLWTVTLEKSQGSKHDMLSIFCHKHTTLKENHNPTLLQQVVCLSVDGLRQSFDVAMAVPANWWVGYSRHSKPISGFRAAVSIFSFADRHILGIAPITESNTIINTAILTTQPVSLPVIVLAVSRDGKVSDVTSAVNCHSSNENTVKVSSDCSTLFVDGSESGPGNTCAMVKFLLGTLHGSVCLEVWAPSVPLQVSLVDPILNAIAGWNHFTDEGCVQVYQRSAIQVLTQFTSQDSQKRTSYLLGSSDWFVDVTELVRKLLRIGNPRVASLGTQNNLIGLQPGKTSLHVISKQRDRILGTCDITVTSDPVTPGDLSVQVISGLGMSVTTRPTQPSIITATVTAYNVLYNHHQEASISVWIQFDDNTASLLSLFNDLPYFLSLSSLAETVVGVTSGPSQRIFAQGDGGGPLVRTELLVSTCADQLITSNSISKSDQDWTDTGGAGGQGTRRLSRGSGWIRVNLDLAFLPPLGDRNEEGEEFEFSHTLVESDSDIYVSNFDNESGNINWNKMRNGGMINQNNLERAVLLLNQEEGSVYLSPSQETKGGMKKEEEEMQGTRELEVSVGAVLSLLCLSAILFLANCLPCILRDQSRTTKQGQNEVELEGGIKEEEAESREKAEGEDREAEKSEAIELEDKTKQEGNNNQDIKEVEII